MGDLGRGRPLSPWRDGEGARAAAVELGNTRPVGPLRLDGGARRGRASLVGYFGCGCRSIWYPSSVGMQLLVASLGCVPAAMVGRHGGVFHGELGRRDGWRQCGRVTCRRHKGVPVRMRPLLLPPSSCSAGSSVGGMGGLDAVTSPVAGTGVCRSGCVRSFSHMGGLGRRRVGAGPPMFGAERLLWLHRSGATGWAKARDFVWSRGCLVAGRRLWRWEARRLGVERASKVQAGNHGHTGGVVAGG